MAARGALFGCAQEPVTYAEGSEDDGFWEVLGGKSKTSLCGAVRAARRVAHRVSCCDRVVIVCSGVRVDEPDGAAAPRAAAGP